MIDDDVAYLNVGPPTAGEREPYQIYEILKERGLLRWGKNGVLVLLCHLAKSVLCSRRSRQNRQNRSSRPNPETTLTVLTV